VTIRGVRARTRRILRDSSRFDNTNLTINRPSIKELTLRYDNTNASSIVAREFIIRSYTFPLSASGP
jgi:hypothetical protein